MFYLKQEEKNRKNFLINFGAIKRKLSDGKKMNEKCMNGKYSGVSRNGAYVGYKIG